MLYKRFSLSLLAIFLLGVAPAVVPVGPHVADAEAAACSPTESEFTGGDGVGTNGVDYKVLEFTTVGSCDWMAPTGVTEATALLVGGGGGGGGGVASGSGAGGGGGGGGYVREVNLVGLTGTQSISVGSGGTGGEGGAPGSNGGSSSLGSSQASGGGGGSGGSGWNNDGTGGDSGFNGTTQSAANANGNRQGSGGSGPQNSGTADGVGGDGFTSNITGTSVVYAGGGGGGNPNGENADAAASGGSGGGGTGAVDYSGDGGGSAAATAGQDEFGGGGGGGTDADHNSDHSDGADGGDGIVIVRYALTPNAPANTSASSADGSITIDFDAPTHWGGGTLTIEYSTDNGSTWRDIGQNTDGPVSVTEESDGDPIANNTLYAVKLRSKNTIGAGLTSSEADLGNVIPSAVGEILRFDGTNPNSYGGTESTWTDISDESNSGTVAGPEWDSRSKSFNFDGTDKTDNVSISSFTYDFSNGFAIHATVDFGDDINNWERILDFGGGEGDFNVWFGRYGNTDDFAFEVFTDSDDDGSGDDPSDYCRTDQADHSDQGIQPGFHTYSVVISETGKCTLYLDGVEQDEQIGRSSWNDNQSINQNSSNFLPDSGAERTSNYLGRSNWSVDQAFEGSIQSVVVYNTAQTTPTCYPVDSTFTGNGDIGEDGVPYTGIAFTTVGDCEWTVPSGVAQVDTLIVAGGGGGGAHVGGGGGAGGFLELTNKSLTPGATVDVTIGRGGVGGYCDGNACAGVSTSDIEPKNGGNSSFSDFSAAVGGGRGGSWDYFDAADGGSGGGDSKDGRGEATAGQGKVGGSYAYIYYTGGGGGAGSAGAAGSGGESNGGASAGGAPGQGGAGLATTLFPDAALESLAVGSEESGQDRDYYFAGGGGGSQHSYNDFTRAAGGIGGGGRGHAPAGTDGESGLAASGGGGGGGAEPNNASSRGGDGGSGVVIVRYSLGPGAPSISSVVSGDQSVDLTFSAPSHTGGAAIEDFEYSLDGTNWSSLSTASAGTETISGLTNGTAYTIRLRAVNSNGNGEVATSSSVTPRGAQTLTWSPTNTSVEVPDGSVTLAPAASALGGVTIEYSVETAGDPSCAIADDSTPTVTFTAAGTCVIRATALEGGAYQTATADVTLTVSKASQTITFSAVSDKTYGDSSFSLTVSASSGLTVTVTPADTSICTVAGTTVSIVTVGTCSLTASQSGNGSYLAATDVTKSFTIDPKSLSVSVSISDKNYDGSSSATVSSTSLSGLETGDSGYVAVDTDEITAVFANPDAGSGKSVSVTFGDDVLVAGNDGDRSGRYTATLAATPTASIAQINQASLSFASSSSMVFGDTLTLVATGGSGSGDLSYAKVSGPCTLSDATVTATGAGSCVVTATRASDTNYNSVTTSNFTITVSKANQTVNFTSSVPVSAVSGTTYTPTATASSGLSVSFAISTGDGSVCSLSGGVITFATSGTCVVTASQAGDSDYNAASSVTQTIVAGKINQTISFPSIAGKDFDDPAFSAGASVSSGRTVTYATSTSAVCGVNASTGVINIKTVGDCTVTASSAGDSSYAAASDVSRTFTISPVLAGKPSITSVSFGDSSVTVGFGAPGNNGGDSIDAYQVVATASGGTVTKPDCSTTSPCTITGLTNGESYTVTVAAINAAGVGPASDASPSIVPATVADAVSGVATTPGDEELAVSWTALTTGQLGGGWFTRYDVYLRTNGGAWGSPVSADGSNNLATRTTTSYTFTGLTNGTAYDVKIVAITSVNETELSSNTSTALGVPATVPDAPTGLTVTALSNTTASAAWTAPLDDGGATITAYDVNLSCSFTNNTDTFCALSGLTAGSRITVTVGATNLIGTGATVSASITMPGGSSGSSDSSDDRDDDSTATTPVPPQQPRLGPTLPRSPRLPLPPTPSPRPEVLTGPVASPPTPTGANARARGFVGGVPAPVTSTPRDDGGVDVTAGSLRLGLRPVSPPSPGATAPAGNSPLTVENGRETAINGGGLLAGSQLQVFLPGADNRELGRIPVQADGSFDGSLAFRSDAGQMPLPIGQNTLQAVGYDSEGNQTVVEMPVNIAQGAPAPEPNRQVGELPDLGQGESLATSAGLPEPLAITAFPDDGRVEMTSGQWQFAVTVGDEEGAVRQLDNSAELRLVQQEVAQATGRGFQSSTRVDIWLFSEPTLLGSVTVGDDGSFAAEFYLDPRFATAGEHTLQLQGVGTDGYVKAVNLGVLVEEPPATTTASAAWMLVGWSAAVAVALVLLVVVLARRRRCRQQSVIQH